MGKGQTKTHNLIMKRTAEAINQGQAFQRCAPKALRVARISSDPNTQGVAWAGETTGEAGRGESQDCGGQP